MPLCIGTGKPAVCFVAVGGSLFSIHSLWTAAKFAIPSIFICFVNHEYRLLKDLWCNAMGTTIETTRFVGMDFDNPNLDMQGIAAGFGARMEKIDKAGTIGEVLARAQAESNHEQLLRQDDHERLLIWERPSMPGPLHAWRVIAWWPAIVPGA